MDFTALIPTRNRPVLLQRALASVLAQQVDGLEVLVIDDGTTDPFAAPLAAMEAAADPRVRFLHLPARANGHGPSYALNAGAAAARGRYLCFLDDDDEWTDPDYLACAARLIDDPAAAGPPPDLLFFDQAAYAFGERIGRTVWIEDLPRLLPPACRPEPDGAYRLTAPDLLRSHGFCHNNNTIVRRAFFTAIGCFDVALRYEQDRDFYLRAIDRAKVIRYLPRTVSRHNAPDPDRRDNTSTLVSRIEKRIFQATLLNKAILFSRQEAVRVYARRYYAYTLKHLATDLYKSGRHAAAREYALEALPLGFNLRWLAFTCWLGLRAAFARGAARTGTEPDNLAA